MQNPSSRIDAGMPLFTVLGLVEQCGVLQRSRFPAPRKREPLVRGSIGRWMKYSLHDLTAAKFWVAILEDEQKYAIIRLY
jgi:hypothetical protein